MRLKLIKVAQDFNVGLHTIVETLHAKGFEIEERPTADVTSEMLSVLEKEFQRDLAIKQEAEKLSRSPIVKKEPTTVKPKVTLAPPPSLKLPESPDKSAPVKAVEIAPSPTPPPIPVAPPAPATPPVLPPPVVPDPVPVASLPEPEPTPPARPPMPELPEKKSEEPTALPKEGETEDPLKEKNPLLPGLRILGKIDLDKPTPKKQADKSKSKPKEGNTGSGRGQRKDDQPTKAKPAQPQPEAKQAPPTPAPAPEAPVPTIETPAPAAEFKTPEPDHFRADTPQLRGLKILGKVDLNQDKKNKPDGGKSGNKGGRSADRRQGGERGPAQPNQTNRPAGSSGVSAPDSSDDAKRKRKRKKVAQPVTEASIKSSLSGAQNRAGGGGRPRSDEAPVVSQKQVEDQIRQTMARMGAGADRKRQKARREKRETMREKAEIAERNASSGKLQVSEFVSVSDLASLLNVKPADVIKVCMSLGIIVGINQRIDAEIIEVVAGEFGYEIEFVSAEEQIEVEEEQDDPADLKPRQPIVTVMGHVDHGKTSLLDYIRSANVAGGEAGGITQHIGAYEVVLEDQRKITFLDTPGHEAFTAMRARGAKVTDVAVIVIAADDNIMPQTREAISHAQAANVPIVFAINKIDKSGADPERIKSELAQMNLMVEEWGGKYQSQDISAKTGLNVDKLLEKVLLEAELLDLKANPSRRASGTVLEASLDKGRGYVTKVLIENGTLRNGDPIIAGEFYGKVKAMFNERGKKIKEAGPATPVLVLGLAGAPQAGEKIKVPKSESEAKEIASKRAQINREQANRASKRISLDEIGRRLALGNFKELNLIVKGDVDGSIEALSDSLIKLSMDKIQVNVIHKAVGQIVDSDVMLASASDAIIVGFQVRPSLTARKLAEKEGVEIKTYSIIYEAIEEIKAAMEGMLEPTKEEEIQGQIEVREVYKISKIGTVAGCYVQDGKISRNHFVRVIRDGIVIYPSNPGQHAELASLKRFKEDAKEVKTNMECGLTIKNFNDIKVGDVIESYTINEVKTRL